MSPPPAPPQTQTLSLGADRLVNYSRLLQVHVRVLELPSPDKPSARHQFGVREALSRLLINCRRDLVVAS